ncbi:MAG: TrmH family RNA methyltransferase [Flavobacteriales bacterium]
MNRQEIQFIRSLRQRSERLAQGVFVVEGIKGIIELANSTLIRRRIYCVAGMVDSLPENLHREAEVIGAKEMTRISQMSTPPGILAIAEIPVYDANEVFMAIKQAKVPFGLVAAHIQDPGNLGTLIRSADWFGFGGVFTTEPTTDPWSSKCVQATMGSLFRMPIAELNHTDSSDLLHYHLEMEGLSYTQVDWKPGLIWVGSESHGFSSISLPESSTPVHIPAHGSAESLNAGVAGSIVCAEIARSLQKPAS